MKTTRVTTYKVIRIYWIAVERKAQAVPALHKLEEQGEANRYLMEEFAVEVKPKGWFQALLKQVTG